MSQSEQEHSDLVLDNIALSSVLSPEQIAQKESYFKINAQKFSTLNAKGELYIPSSLAEVRIGATEAGSSFSRAFKDN